MSNPSSAVRNIWSSPRGFTAIELVIVMAIVTVLAALALPDLSNALVNQRLRSAGTDLMSSLIVARSEAIKRNGPVEVIETTYPLRVLSYGLVPNSEGAGEPASAAEKKG